MKNLILIVLSAIILFWSSCTESEIKDTQTSGSIQICVDETYRPVMEQQIEVFESRYPNTKINVEYLPEIECFNRFFEDTTRVIFVSRELTVDEVAYAKTKKIVPKTMAMARDALAFIVANDAPTKNFSVAQIKEILTGKNTKGNYQLVFDNQKSSTVRYLADTLIGGEKLSSNIYAAKGSEDVIDYVAKNPNAIGVVGVPWVADRNDSTTIEFMNKVQVVGILPDGGTDYIKPYQAYIGLNTYPFTRNLYFISKETWIGLGTGFVNYLCRDGQVLFKQAKLFPLRVNVLLKETNIKDH